MLARVARNSTSRVGSPIFNEALSTYVLPTRPDDAFPDWGAFYNEEERLLYLRVGGTVLDKYTDPGREVVCSPLCLVLFCLKIPIPLVCVCVCE
jgi:hypothetical protein